MQPELAAAKWEEENRYNPQDLQPLPRKVTNALLPTNMILIALHLDVSLVVMADCTLPALLVLLVLLPLDVLVSTSADQPLLPRDWLLWTMSTSATQNLEVATSRDLESFVTWSYISNMK